MATFSGIDRDALVIALMGVTKVRKSQFIKLATGLDVPISGGLEASKKVSLSGDNCING